VVIFNGVHYRGAEDEPDGEEKVVAVTDTAKTDGVLSDLRDWLGANWDPDLTVGDWWERLGLAGWAAPGLPANAYGRAMARADTVLVQREISSFGALGAPAGLGLLLAAPTIATHGTQEQIDLYVRDIVCGRKAWCQLFSEPQAGSDLAGLQTRAIRDGDEWVINGQKVWTSGGQFSDLGMLLARTDANVPKHQGISYFAFDMHEEGADVRPLREMTGHALFNEVFLTDARVANSALIGGVNKGWAAANTTLMNERAGLGSGGGNSGGGGVGAQPGTVLGHLSRRAGDCVPSRDAGERAKKRSKGSGEVWRALARGVDLFIDEARARGVHTDPVIRQDLVRLYTLGELGRMNGLRLKAVKAQGSDIAGLPNVAKLMMSQTVRLSRDLGLSILGPSGTLHSYSEDTHALADASGGSLARGITEIALFAQAPPIYGGSDQVQRNIIGERVLQLPKEPNSDRTTPFSELPKNA
jgi:alkylation response protein AidB-like acyl-CoA dehydrogenase